MAGDDRASPARPHPTARPSEVAVRRLSTRARRWAAGMAVSRPATAPATDPDRRVMIDAAGLKQSWDLISRYGDQVPLFFYSTLFLGHPYTRAMFPVSMAAQRDRLAGALGRIVSQVDDLDAIRPMLQRLGRDHRKFGVVRDHYPAVGDALLATLEHFCGSQWTEELAQDWRCAYPMVL